MVTYQVKALLTTAVVSGRVGQTVYTSTLLEAREKTAELLYMDCWEAWEAVFDPNHSAGPAAEYPNNEDLLKNKH